MNKFFLIVLAVLLFSCKSATIQLVEDAIKEYEGLEIVLPAEGDEMKVNPDNITVISINESGQVLFNGELVKEKQLDKDNLDQLKSLVENELINNDKMIFSIQVTPKTQYSDYIEVLDYIKAAKATKISITN
tara:strand:- start:312 stop:707 length:396 start_codon:yes stop_codon:yes gene_type:complete